jgi:hypothetical protein
MSLLSNFIKNNLIKALEDELIDMAPELREMAIKEIKELGLQAVQWAEEKLNFDINGDGKIG